MIQIDKTTAMVLGAVVLLLIFTNVKGCPVGPGPGPTPPANQITIVTYFWDKETTGTVPGPILDALDELNKRPGLTATNFENDDDVPENLKDDLAAARQVGLPAIVAANKDRVIRAAKDPKTTEQALAIAL